MPLVGFPGEATSSRMRRHTAVLRLALVGLALVLGSVTPRAGAAPLGCFQQIVTVGASQTVLHLWLGSRNPLTWVAEVARGGVCA